MLLPRPTPCRCHRRFHSSRLYLTLLLLLLAGDVELNPGPVQTSVELTECIDRETKTSTNRNTDNDKDTCTVCGMPMVSLQLRTRTITNTRVNCKVVNCPNFIHYGCTDANKQTLSVGWACPKHMYTESSLNNGTVPCAEQSEEPASPAEEDHLSQTTNRIQEQTPGPSLCQQT